MNFPEKKYPVIFQYDEDDGYWGELPDFDCALPTENTLEEAVGIAEKMLSAMCGIFIEEGTPLPEPTDFEEVKKHFLPDCTIKMLSAETAKKNNPETDISPITDIEISILEPARAVN